MTKAKIVFLSRNLFDDRSRGVVKKKETKMGYEHGRFYLSIDSRLVYQLSAFVFGKVRPITWPYTSTSPVSFTPIKRDSTIVVDF